MNRLVICGSRDARPVRVYDLLDGWAAGRLVAAFSMVAHGGAHGADRLGAAWAQSRIPMAEIVTFVPDWSRGPGAGPMRNEQMARWLAAGGGASRCVALWDGRSRGTADMMGRAAAHGLPVDVLPLVAPSPRGSSVGDAVGVGGSRG